MLPLPSADVLNHQRAAARAGIAMVATIRPKRSRKRRKRGQIYFHGEKMTAIPDRPNQNPARLPPNTALYNPYTTKPLPHDPPNPKNKKAPDLSTWGFFISYLVHPAGFEPTTPAFGGQYSIQLSYGCLCGRHHTHVDLMRPFRHFPRPLSSISDKKWLIATLIHNSPRRASLCLLCSCGFNPLPRRNSQVNACIPKEP